MSLDLPTRLELFAIGRAYTQQRSKKIDPRLVDVEGSDVNIVVGSQSVMSEHVTKHLLYRTAALSLAGSEDEDLDRWVYDRYQMFRKGASAALVTVVISRLSAGGGAGTVPAGTSVVTESGIEYVLITDATFGPADLESRADARAAQAGKATQVAKETIKRFKKPGEIFDRTLTPNNPIAAAGGEDAESNETLRERAALAWVAQRRGILEAIEFGARSVEGVESAVAEEVLSGDGNPARLVNLYVADSSGVANEALSKKVKLALKEWRAAGIYVVISTSLPLYVDITLKLSFRANVDTDALRTIVQNATVAFVNSLPVNSPLYVSALYSLLQRYTEDGLVVSEDSIVIPVGDLLPTVGTTIRTSLERVTIL